MKHKKLIILSAAVALAVGGTVTAVGVDNQVVQAKSSNKKSVFPKKVRGSWYRYLGKDLIKETFTAKKMMWYTNGKKQGYSNLHVYKAHVDPHKASKKYLRKTQHWVTGGSTANGSNFAIMPWNYYGAGTHELYEVDKMGGHQVLTEYTSVGLITGHYYRTPKLAKKLQSKHYKKFKGRY
ncbi:hypothetical protein PT285_09970 [Lactobacillus sp. ESL0791]|uniref:hypothetical protein n=1 Tax=Lactobacillus sp. ESL0791 TaxID=2983234 RepID=UPI0023F872A9|nr:hypothetical protein [Lactobacillus sp. ESL0791]MDF7639727.1 hypothetical protein [Lactobacillus sp. ESL0791]